VSFFDHIQNSLAIAKTRIRDDYRSLRDVGIANAMQFRRLRRGAAHQAVFRQSDPLVSICIATYNKSELLIRRAIASSLAQTYKNLDIVVVGDHCTDDTEERMRSVTDPRVRFVNLPQRGNYPTEPRLRWLVAGNAPFNAMLKMVRGDFITHLDHDDEYVPDRIETLVAFAQAHRADIVYHPFLNQHPDGEWHIHKASRFAYGHVTSSAIFYHRSYATVEADMLCYRYGEAGDWNRARRLRFLGARIVRHPAPLTKHFMEGTMRDASAMSGIG
jgi:glycosyltransferase involved in cell wall biosynthesis